MEAEWAWRGWIAGLQVNNALDIAEERDRVGEELGKLRECKALLMEHAIKHENDSAWDEAKWHEQVAGLLGPDLERLDNLTAYRVGDYDMVLAYNPSDAMVVLSETIGVAELNSQGLTLDDVEEVSEKTLSLPLRDEDGNDLRQTLQQFIYAVAKRGYLLGWE